MKLNDREDTFLVEYLTELSYDTYGIDDVNFIYNRYKLLHDALIHIPRIPNMSLLYLFKYLLQND